jgi:hypothetical protein
MARFRIIDQENNGHYLRTDPPTEWEQVEVDQKTGKQGRHRYVVPMLLDPKDPGTHNYSELGQIIVSTRADPMYPRDIVILDPPTMGMEPLDAEAEVLMRKVMLQPDPMSEAAFPSTMSATASLEPKPDRFDEFSRMMQAQMAGLIGQNETLMARLRELEETAAPPPAPPAKAEKGVSL